MCTHVYDMPSHDVSKAQSCVVTRSKKHPHNRRYVSKSDLQLHNIYIKVFKIFPKGSDVGRAKQKTQHRLSL
jgi:hypothetical protein